MGQPQDFKTLQESLQKALLSTTRTVNILGTPQLDLPFQRTVKPDVSDRVDKKSEQLLQLASDLLKSAGNATNQRVSALEDIDDVDINWRSIVDVLDSLLEKADTCLDEYTGIIKRKDAPTAEAGRAPKRPTTERLDWSLKRANILKPQNTFERKPDNFDQGPWKPLLSSKPHAQVSLEESLTTFVDENQNTQYKHPYETEITNLKYPESVYEKCEPQMYTDIDATQAIWVDTYEGVLEMLEELKKAKEIAVDLEHHDYRTYSGLLSLMQISTRDKDWIVDTLQPWRHKLEVLNEVFADPSIVKVLHGAFMDIVWLQRDLGLYVVGLFDTHHASAALGYAGRSLAFLLKKFADFDADKKYQLADWRIRPLPEQMFYYARSDTHYLLYIYDMLRNELAEKSDRSKPERDLTGQVIRKSKEVSLQRYENLTYDPETGIGSRGWFNALVRAPTLYDSEQFAVYKAVHKWRDDIARREDESPFFYMSQQVLNDIARIKPTDKKALWSILDTNARGLKKHLDELFDVVQQGIADGVNGPRMVDYFRSVTARTSPSADKPAVKAAAEAVVEAMEVDDVLDISELKKDKSQLWGDVPLSSVWEDGPSAVKKRKIASAADNETMDVITFTYPHLGEAGEEDEEEAEEQVENLGPSPEELARLAALEAERDREFTLRQGQGRKRKIEEAESDDEDGIQIHDEDAQMEDATATDGVSSSKSPFGEEEEEEEGEASESLTKQELDKIEKKKKRAELKKAKKAAKKAAKQAPQGQSEEGEVDEEEEEETPFDYANAQSVLRANGNGANGDDKRKKKGKKAFNPYGNRSQQSDFKAVRNLNYEKKGRTATFKK